MPIEKDRPSEARYFDPPPQDRHRFTADAMPVVAYLDAGIYCHPIVPGVVDAVKVGYYNPPDVPRGTTTIDSIDAFVERCFPALLGMPSSTVQDVDQCDYDLVADDDFVLGAIPGAANAFVGVGWRGTGYKFAPWVGRVLAELAVQAGTVYAIDRFDPARFEDANRPRCPGRQGPCSNGSLRASSSARRATSSSSSAAATSRPGRSSPRSSSTRPTRWRSCTASSCAPARRSWWR